MSDISKQIRELARLRDQGRLTEEAFALAKADVLAGRTPEVLLSSSDADLSIGQTVQFSPHQQAVPRFDVPGFDVPGFDAPGLDGQATSAWAPGALPPEDPPSMGRRVLFSLLIVLLVAGGGVGAFFGVDHLRTQDTTVAREEDRERTDDPDEDAAEGAADDERGADGEPDSSPDEADASVGQEDGGDGTGSDEEPTPERPVKPGPDEVLLPADLVGRDGEDVAAQLEARGLVVVTDSQPLDEVAGGPRIGQVIDTDPAPGTIVEDGTIVTVIVAAAPTPEFEPGQMQVPGCAFDVGTVQNWASLTDEEKQAIAPIVRFASSHNANVAGIVETPQLECAWTAFSSHYRDFHGLRRAAWTDDQATTSFRRWTIDAITINGDVASVNVEFVSQQAPDKGREPGETCTEWGLSYRLALRDGIWLLDERTGFDHAFASSECG